MPNHRVKLVDVFTLQPTELIYHNMMQRKIHTICLMAMSSDFFDIVLPNPVLSGTVDEGFTGFRIDNSEMCAVFRDSSMSACPLERERLLPGGSMSLPLVTIGDECLLDIFTEPVLSGFPFTITEPGLDRPADTGLSGGKVVLRFDSVSRGKSGGTTGCCGGRTRGLGEFVRDAGPEVRPFDITRPTEVDGLTAGVMEETGFRRVGVNGREFDRDAVEFKFAGT